MGKSGGQVAAEAAEMEKKRGEREKKKSKASLREDHKFVWHAWTTEKYPHPFPMANWNRSKASTYTALWHLCIASSSQCPFLLRGFPAVLPHRWAILFPFPPFLYSVAASLPFVVPPRHHRLPVQVASIQCTWR